MLGSVPKCINDLTSCEVPGSYSRLKYFQVYKCIAEGTVLIAEVREAIPRLSLSIIRATSK